MRNYVKYGLTGLLVVILATLGKPILRLFQGFGMSENVVRVTKPGSVDDASHLNNTAVDSVVNIATGRADAIEQLRALLAYARSHDLKVSIAGAKHSMGGHTITPDGIQLNMLPFNEMQLDTSTNILTVGSGALWSEVIPYLNAQGRAVAIMQSDNVFSVGGSVSVNCHGWQHNNPPIASTVVAFTIMLADGSIRLCDRKYESELFSMALGGYGLFGVILDVSLRTVPNELYRYHRVLMSPDKYIEYYGRLIDADTNVRMVYGRLNVSVEEPFTKAMLHYFTYEKNLPPGHPLKEPSLVEVKRSIFTGSRKDEYGKKLRWNSEQAFSKISIGGSSSRNDIMNEAPFYLNYSDTHTDILHEYFIPRRNFNEFIEQLRSIVPKHDQNLLNVTIRNVLRDEDVFLRYASEEMFAFVMFFEQERTPEAEKAMRALTTELIDAALQLEGTFYLPYRLHASGQQLVKGYPRINEYFERKCRYDPEAVFSNMFFKHYGPGCSNL